MSVVGFDIGNENCVIAVAKQRGIDVLLNDESKRETPAVVSFGDKQRFMGSAGAASATMNPRSTILQVKRLIGRKFNEPDLEKELKMFPFETFESPNGGVSIRLQFMGEVHEFTPVQILGMLLSHLKQIAEKNLQMPVSDCVIGIPSYFTDLQRRAYLDAAVIAGLRPLRLLHDCTATALGYGIYKNDLSNSGPVYTIFVDIGHCDTQVCAASLEAGQMKIISHAFDRSLGGRDFDEVLFNHFASQFKEQYNIDVHTNIKASVRLRASCEKLKKVLSANAEAPLNIECLMDEKDVKGLIKREEFEKLSSDLLERITVPCHKILADSGLTLDKINSVELVGSGSRVLKILNAYRSFANESDREEISRKLQQTEDWLYDDGMDESENVYVEKLKDLRKLLDPIENRYKDEDARVQAKRDLLKCIEDNRTAAASLPSVKKDVVSEECTIAERWLQEKSQQQNSLPKDVDPIVWSSEIKRKAEALEATCKHMIRSNASTPCRDDMNDSDQGGRSDSMQLD